MLPSFQSTNRRWKEYLLAATLAVVVVLLRVALAPWIGGDRPFLIVFVLPIFVSAYRGGAGPGLVATALAALGANFFVLSPTRSFAIAHSVDLTNWLLLVGAGVLVSLLIESLHQARRRAEASVRALQQTERALGESQRLLQAISDNSTAVIYAKDLAGRYLFVNRRYTEIFHRTQEVIIGHTDHELFPPAAAQAFRGMDERVAAANTPLVEEETAPLDDGLHTYVSVKCPLHDAAGNVCGIFGISTDITDRKRVEGDLRAREEQLRLIIDNALDAVITIDPAGVITGWNPQAEATFGWSRREALGRVLADTIVPLHYRERHRQGLARYLATGEPVVLNRRIEVSALHRDGREFPVELAITPLRLGGTISFSAFVRDITGRKGAQEALAARERQYRLLFDESPVPKWVYDTASLRFLAVNKAAQRHYGYTEQEFLSMTIRDIRPPEDIPALEADVALADGEEVRVSEWRHRKKNGSIIRVVVSAHDISLQGRLARMVVVQDITDRKLAETRVQAQLARLDLLHRITRATGERQDLRSIFQVVLHSLEDHLRMDFCCMCLFDPVEGALTLSQVGARSEALAHDLGLTERAKITIDENGLSRCVRGQLVYEPDIEGAAFPFSQRLARSGLRALVLAPLLVESKVFGVFVGSRRAADSFSSGECEFLRQLCEHTALAANQAQLYGALQQAYEDLRQTQQVIMQQERLRALGQMASGIAHDINNAISPAALYAESLLETDPSLSPRARERLTVIQRALEDVAQTVARLREFYRQREPQLQLTPVDLNLLVPQVLELTRARWQDIPQQRGSVVHVATELAAALPAITGVEAEIREALTNLILNAVDAMPEGGTLTLRTRSLTSRPAGHGTPVRQACIEIVDTGVGMDADTRRRCLEPFFTTKGDRGTGLGLAMVYGTAQRHGADLQVESAVGHGTTMRLIFPAHAAPETAPEGPRLASSPPARLRLLVIDDDPLVLRSLRDILEADGHVVVTAAEGRSGIEAFRAAHGRKEAFAAVITDLGMPYIDGRKVASEIKSVSSDTPVILLTGWGERLTAEGEVPPHVDRVLAKPPKLRDLRDTLADCCRGTRE
jgi:PAS domain S-box-containing protein